MPQAVDNIFLRIRGIIKDFQIWEWDFPPEGFIFYEVGYLVFGEPYLNETLSTFREVAKVMNGG